VVSGRSWNNFIGLGLLCGFSLAGRASLPFQPPGPLAYISASGQFVVRSTATAGPSATALGLGARPGLVCLEQQFVAISAERIKRKLLNRLDAPSQWAGKIYLMLHPAANANEAITITSAHFRDGWQYRVDLPDVTEQKRYVRAITQVLLLEMANRDAGLHSAEVPLWLSTGISEQLLASDEVQIILSPPSQQINGVSFTRTLVDKVRQNPLEQAYKELSSNQPLSFDQLSWPTPAALSGQNNELYRKSAQLFVDDLFQFKDGRACFRAMLADLPKYYNWQFAFLRGFHSHFQTALDVEKWWALRSTCFTSRDLSQTWPARESLQKLDEAVRWPVQIRSATNDLPLHASVPLQVIIGQWSGPLRDDALKNKLVQLEVLRSRVARRLQPLTTAYYQVIRRYLQKHGHNEAEAIRQLDLLDARRQLLEPENKTAKSRVELLAPQPIAREKPGALSPLSEVRKTSEVQRAQE
jgi:hypothetical protein